MLSIRYRPEAATTILTQWLRPRIRYDADGRFSMMLVDEQPLPGELRRVANIVCPEVDADLFRGVVLQAYQHGRAVTPCHSDAPVFGFILSLGARRTFRIHREPCRDSGCRNSDLDAVSIECVNGTAIIMDADFHEGWHHQIVGDPAVTQEKLSLVFRTSLRSAS